MDFIRSKDDLKLAHVREYLRGELPAMHLEMLRYLLKQPFDLCTPERSVLLGAYVLAGRQNDDIFFRLKERLRPTSTALFSEEEKQVMLSVVESVDLGSIVATIEKEEKEKLGVTELPPPIFRGGYDLTQLYKRLLYDAGIRTWKIAASHEKPVDVYTKDPAVTLKKLRQSPIGGHLIQFINLHQTDIENEWKDDVLVSGSRFDGHDFRYLLHAPLQFNLCTGGRGTVNLFLDMNHPTLGKSRVAMTSAHVAFSELSSYSQDRIDDFNAKVDFAHYEIQEMDPFMHALDFCIFEVSSREHVQNIVANSSRILDLTRHEIADESRIFKYGGKTGLTCGTFYQKSAKVTGRAYVAVSSPLRGRFAAEGDSGAVYLYLDENDEFFPFALHRCSNVHANDEGIWLSGGCSIVECLRKYVQKRTRASQPPSIADVMEWFKVSAVGRLDGYPG